MDMLSGIGANPTNRSRTNSLSTDIAQMPPPYMAGQGGPPNPMQPPIQPTLASGSVASPQTARPMPPSPARPMPVRTGGPMMPPGPAMPAPAGPMPRGVMPMPKLNLNEGIGGIQRPGMRELQ